MLFLYFGELTPDGLEAMGQFSALEELSLCNCFSTQYYEFGKGGRCRDAIINIPIFLSPLK